MREKGGGGNSACERCHHKSFLAWCLTCRGACSNSQSEPPRCALHNKSALPEFVYQRHRILFTQVFRSYVLMFTSAIFTSAIHEGRGIPLKERTREGIKSLCNLLCRVGRYFPTIKSSVSVGPSSASGCSIVRSASSSFSTRRSARHVDRVVEIDVNREQ